LATPDPTRRSLVGNRQVRQFEQKPVSEYEPIKTDDLIGRNIIVLGVVGDLNVGQYGPSWVVEITTPEDTTIGHSWLVNKASVLGRQLETEREKGARAFPFEVSLQEMTGTNGRMYITFAPPTTELPWDANGGKASK